MLIKQGACYEHVPFRLTISTISVCVMGSYFYHISRYLKPPYDPGQSNFPSPVLTLAFLPSAFPIKEKFKRWHTCAPSLLGFHTGLVPTSRCGILPALRLDAHLEPPSAQSPFARSTGVTSAGVVSMHPWKDITPSSSLIRTHASDHPPPDTFSTALCVRSLQVVTSPCCEVALPDVISASPS